MKKMLIILLSVVVIVLLYFGISTFMFFQSAKDVTNVNIKGYVYQAKNKKPLEGCKVVIFNSSYKAKGNDYTDYSSYLGHDTIPVTTNDKGYYSVKIDRSARLYIKVFKEGYKLSESDGMNVRKKIKQDFYMEEGESKESDLYKPIEVIEIEE